MGKIPPPSHHKPKKFLVRGASGGYLEKLTVFFPRELFADTDRDSISSLQNLNLSQSNQPWPAPAPPKLQHQQSHLIIRYFSTQDPLKPSVAGRWHSTFEGQPFSEDVWFLGFPPDLGMSCQKAILPQKTGWQLHVLKMQLKCCCSK